MAARGKSRSTPRARTDSAGPQADATARAGAPRRAIRGSWFDWQWSGHSAGQERIKVHQHSRRSPPDVVLAVWHGVVIALAAFAQDPVALVVRRVEKNASGTSNTSATTK